jgi:hypothetical protein
VALCIIVSYRAWSPDALAIWAIEKSSMAYSSVTDPPME